MRWPHQKREDRGRRRKRPSHPPSATGQRFRWQPRQKKGTKSEREDGSEEVTGNRGNLLSRPCETGLSEPRAAHHGHEGHLQLKLILSKFGPKLPSGNESATPIFKPASPSQMKNGRKRKVVACSKHTVMVSVLASLFILLPILSSAAPISHPAVTNQSGHLNKASGSGALGGILASVGAVLALAGAVVWWQNRSRSPEGQQNFPTDDESGTKLQSGDDIENTSLRKDRSAKVVTNFRSCEKSAIHIPVTIKANVHSAISSFASYRWRIISDIYSTCSDNRKHHRVWQELQPKSEENVQEGEMGDLDTDKCADQRKICSNRAVFSPSAIRSILRPPSVISISPCNPGSGSTIRHSPASSLLVLDATKSSEHGDGAEVNRTKRFVDLSYSPAGTSQSLTKSLYSTSSSDEACESSLKYSAEIAISSPHHEALCPSEKMMSTEPKQGTMKGSLNSEHCHHSASPPKIESPPKNSTKPRASLPENTQYGEIMENNPDANSQTANGSDTAAAPSIHSYAGRLRLPAKSALRQPSSDETRTLYRIKPPSSSVSSNSSSGRVTWSPDVLDTDKSAARKTRQKSIPKRPTQKRRLKRNLDPRHNATFPGKRVLLGDIGEKECSDDASDDELPLFFFKQRLPQSALDQDGLVESISLYFPPFVSTTSKPGDLAYVFDVGECRTAQLDDATQGVHGPHSGAAGFSQQAAYAHGGYALAPPPPPVQWQRDELPGTSSNIQNLSTLKPSFSPVRTLSPVSGVPPLSPRFLGWIPSEPAFIVTPASSEACVRS